MVLFIQNKVYTWFIGCMRFWCCCYCYYLIFYGSIYFMKYHSVNIQLSSHNDFSAQSLFITPCSPYLPSFALWSNSIRYDVVLRKYMCVSIYLYLRYITPKSIFIAKSLHMFSIRHRLEITWFKFVRKREGERENDRPYDRLEITISKMIVFDGLIRK